MSRVLGLALLLLLGPQFTTGVTVVEVYATVTDRDGKPVTGLTRSDFTVLADGEPRPITTFAAGETPLAVAIALDRSFSMAGPPLATARSAARTFLGALRPGDQSMILAIGSVVEVIAPLSTDRGPQQRALDRLDAWGTTPLYDAIIAAIDPIQQAGGRRALVLLSDGDERYSEASAADALQRARESDVIIYPVAFGKARPEIFAQLAVLTGGRSFRAPRPQDIGPTFDAIIEDLRHQYLIGFAPAERASGEAGVWHPIEVRVNRPGVRVRARDGYVG